MLDEIYPLTSTNTANNCALALNNDFGAHILEVGFKVESKKRHRAMRACGGSVQTSVPLVLLYYHSI